MKKPAQLCKLVDLSKLSRAKARVEIAKDVIAALDAEYIRTGPKTDTSYLTLRVQGMGSEYEGQAFDLKELLSRKVEDCQVCARGALLLAVVARDNEFRVEMSSSRNLRWLDDDVTRLMPFFSDSELYSLETAFEEGGLQTQEDRTAFLRGCMERLIRTKGRNMLG